MTDTQVSKNRKAFGNCSSANINFLKTQLSKMMQLAVTFPSFLFEVNLAKNIDWISSIMKSILKESMNIGTKKLEDKL